MKFGKQLLSQQRPAWARYYLDYKALKKIIAGKLHPGASPAGPGAPQGTRTAFFDALGREVDKINSFYLDQQRAIQGRVQALVDVRAALARANAPSRQAAEGVQPPTAEHHQGGDPEDPAPAPVPLGLAANSPTVRVLREAWAAVLVDLARLEQFVELNAVGLRKILKKWDKRSKSQVRELYLARQLDVQPCFDRTLIGTLAATASSQLASLVLPAPVATSCEAALAQKEQALATALDQGKLEDAATYFPANDQECVRSALWRVLWDHLASAGPATESIIAAATSTSSTPPASILADAAFSHRDDITARHGLHMAAGAGLDVASAQDRCADLLRAGLAYVVRATGTESDEATHKDALLKATRALDTYSRFPLGYVAVRGCAPAVSVLLPHMRFASTESPDGALTAALQLAVQENHLEVVRKLLGSDAPLSSVPITDLAQPLTLAAERGRGDILRLLLPAPQDGQDAAPILGSAALAAARAGSTECLSILLGVGAPTEVRDALRDSWTPLFFAAEQGDVEAAESLLAHNADALAVDEKERTASFYAAWEGKIQVAQLLLEAEHKAASSTSPSTKKVATDKKAKKAELDSAEAVPALSLDDGMPDLSLGASAQGEADAIPSLALPPPILPFRTYGASYLGDLGDGSPEQALVSLTLSRKSIELDPVRIPLPPSPSLAPYPQRLPPGQPRSPTTSASSAFVAALPLPLKLTLSASTSSMSVPWNITLPLTRTERIALRVPNGPTRGQKGTEGVQLEFHLSTAFGRTIFARATLDPLAGTADAHQETRSITVPLEDVPGGHGPIGQLTVDVQVVTPFPFDHKHSIPDDKVPEKKASAAATTTSPAPSASSMPGRYLRVAVRVVRSVTGEAQVLAGPWQGPLGTPLTPEQLRARAPASGGDDLVAWGTALEGTTVALDNLLATLPPTVGVAVHVLRPEVGQEQDANRVVDAILRSVYLPASEPATRPTKMRNLIFSSDDPAVCTALNWKQPNYAVLFVAGFGVDDTTQQDGRLAATSSAEADSRCACVSEAVRFARDDNLLGLVLPHALVDAAPALVPAIQGAGLLAVLASSAAIPTPSVAVTNGHVPDGFANSTILVCKPPQQE